MRRVLIASLPFIAFLVLATVISQNSAVVGGLRDYIEGSNMLLSYTAYVVLLVVAVVCMPFTVMPLIPVIATIFGPFITGVLSIIGWTLGSVVAFLIARYLGRPVIGKYIPLRKLDALVERFPHKSRFLFVVLLRLTLPVDLVSYALGLTKSLGFIEYSIATFVGVAWFSFAFAYLGDALLSGNFLLASQLGTVSLVIFSIGWYLLKRSKNSNREIK